MCDYSPDIVGKYDLSYACHLHDQDYAATKSDDWKRIKEIDKRFMYNIHCASNLCVAIGYYLGVRSFATFNKLKWMVKTRWLKK